MFGNDGSVGKKVLLTILEDQDGDLLYTSEKNDDNNRVSNGVVYLHEQNIALQLVKKEKNIEIYCHILVSKGRGRETGLFIFYKNTYSKNVFEHFKKCGENKLNEMGFVFINEEGRRNIYENNIILKNISNFDTGKNYLRNFDIYCLKEVLERDPQLTFSGGNIDTISDFVRILLNNVSEFSLCISSKKCESCRINIQYNFDKPELSPIGKTENIIEDIKNKKREKEAPESFKKTVKQLQGIGWDNSKITKYLYKNCFSLGSPIDNFIFTLVDSEIQLRDPIFLNEDEKAQAKENLTKTFIKLSEDLKSKNMVYSKLIEDQFIGYERLGCQNSPQNERFDDIPQRGKSTSLSGNQTFKNLLFFKHFINKIPSHLFNNKNSPSSSNIRKRQNGHKMRDKAREEMRTKYNSIFILLLLLAGIFILIVIICYFIDGLPFPGNYTNLSHIFNSK